MIAEAVAAAVIIAGANYTDYASTQRALGRDARELTLSIGSNGERLALVKATTTAVETAVFCGIRKHHKKTAWAFVGMVVATNLIIAHQNDKTAR